MFILGIAIFLISTFLTVILLAGNWTYFINLPTMLMVLIPLAAVMTATKSFKVFYYGLKAVVLPKKPITEELRGQAASLFRLLSKSTAIISALGFLISLINMLLGMDYSYPDIQDAIARNIGAALVIFVYGLFLIVAVFEPTVFNLKKRRDTERK
jgi:flagellar motor component MotA